MDVTTKKVLFHVVSELNNLGVHLHEKHMWNEESAVYNDALVVLREFCVLRDNAEGQSKGDQLLQDVESKWIEILVSHRQRVSINLESELWRAHHRQAQGAAHPLKTDVDPECMDENVLSAFILHNMAVLKFHRNSKTQSSEILRLARSLPIEQSDHQVLVASIHFVQAQLYTSVGQESEALREIFKCLSYQDNAGDENHRLFAGAFFALGTMLRRAGYAQDALLAFHSASNIYIKFFFSAALESSGEQAAAAAA